MASQPVPAQPTSSSSLARDGIVAEGVKTDKNETVPRKETRKSLSHNVRTREDALKAFRIPPRYKLQDVLGQGAYGVVVSALDTETKEIVAVKKIERLFDHETFTKRTLREIRVLKLLKHENIISLKSVFASAKAKNDFDDLYLVFDLMETDLASIIKSQQPLTGHHVQFFVYQILRGLKFLHSAGIIHRDIKPRNLLVNSNCDLKICDMGLARFDTGFLTNCPPMTDYIATRWYRAPEIILQWEGYGKPIDLWSVGCILAELIGRKPIFPGNEADHQITLICDVLGRPSQQLVDRCPHPETVTFLLELPRKASHPLHFIYQRADVHSIDLLTKLLRFDPDKRLTVNECLKHPYLAQLHCPQDEPDSAPLQLIRDFPFDAVKHPSGEQLLEFVLDDIDLYGVFYIDPNLDGNASATTSKNDKSSNDSRPPSGSPPPFSPPPSVGGPPATVPLNPGHNQAATATSATATAAAASSSTKKQQDNVAQPKKKNGKSGKPATPQRTYVLSKTGNAAEDSLSPALVVHSPIFESSQDSTLPPHSADPSTPSNVSMELGRLGAAIDELRAM